MDILNALIAASRDKDINNRNWCQHFLKHLCARDIDIEFEPVGTPESVEYIYYVEGVVNNLGGKAPIDGAEFASNIRIEVVDALSGQVMFSNRMEQYAEWLREQDGSMLD